MPYFTCPERRIPVPAFLTNPDQLLETTCATLFAAQFLSLSFGFGSLFLGNLLQFDFFMLFNFSRMQLGWSTAVGAGGSRLVSSEAVCASAQGEVPFRCISFRFFNTLCQRPLYVRVRQLVPRVVCYAVDNLRRLTGKVPHASHRLLVIQRQ